MKVAVSIIFIILLFANLPAQAKLIIENDSKRTMTVKIMKNNYSKGILHETVVIVPFRSATVYFSYTGYYFTKTKAFLPNKETIYQKGEPFHVVNDDTGYSEITITFSIKESSTPQVIGGKQITKQEFERD